MANTVRAALLQTDWAGTKAAMIDKHDGGGAQAASRRPDRLHAGAVLRPLLLCRVQDAPTTTNRPIPDGPTTKRFARPAKKHGMVLVVPVYEVDLAGVYYNTAAVVDADGTYLGQYRKMHIPKVNGVLREVLLPARQPRLPDLRHHRRQGRRLHLLRPPLPGGPAALGLNGAEILFNPSATAAAVGVHLELEQPTAAVANKYYVGAINRVGIEADIGDDDFYGQSYFVDPEGKFVGDVGDAYKPELIVRDLDMDKIKLVRDRWAFYRDRRPDAYGELVEA